VTQTGNDDGVETERTELAAVRRLGGMAEGSADLERSWIMEIGRAADGAAGTVNDSRLSVQVVQSLGADDKHGVMILRRRRLRVLSKIREGRCAWGSRRAAGSRRPDGGAHRC
jgi:hypothetical protein